MQTPGQFFLASKCLFSMVVSLFMHVWFVEPSHIQQFRFKTPEVNTRHFLHYCFIIVETSELCTVTQRKPCLDYIAILYLYISLLALHDCLFSSLYCKACMSGKYEKSCFPAGSHLYLLVFLWQHDFVDAEHYCLNIGKTVTQ